MCGITGVFHYEAQNPVDSELLQRMTRCIAHRGPDDEGFFISQEHGVGFGHRRLSIIDLATGHQPMFSATGNVCIVFNGEIYNCWELRKDLEAKGHKFLTKSDTEVIINFYEEYGEEEFFRLNGIFAFALFDKRDGSVVLARDHFGIKPLYYAVDHGRLLFGSEIKTILQDPSFPRAIDFEAFNSFLTFRYNPSPQTLFKGIRKLPPACYLKARRGKDITVCSYWKNVPKTDLRITEHDAILEYQRLLEAAVHRQMLSDVPVGLLLSGGVDSGVVGLLMQSVSREKIKTFTIGFAGEGDYNELVDAKITANFIGSDHYERTLSRKEYLDFFYKSFYFTEEPIAETTIPALYYVSQLAAEYVKVVLAGQGADEPLAGYQRYFGERQVARYAPLMKLLPLHTIASMLPRNERFKRAVYASGFDNELERFLAIYTIFTPDQKASLLDADVLTEMTNVDKDLVQRLYDSTSGLSDSLSKILYIDSRMSLSDDLLLFGDKMAMANSLEMRVPFLDVQLMQFIETLPSNLKLRRRDHKYIHKKAVVKWLPKEIIYRKKRGFVTPMDEWLQHDFADVAKKILNEPDSACRKYCRLDQVNKMIEMHQRRQENYQKHIFTLLSFEIWHKSFFEKKEIELPAEDV